jgi:hypothetical protein
VRSLRRCLQCSLRFHHRHSRLVSRPRCLPVNLAFNPAANPRPSQASFLRRSPVCSLHHSRVRGPVPCRLPSHLCSHPGSHLHSPASNRALYLAFNRRSNRQLSLPLFLQLSPRPALVTSQRLSLACNHPLGPPLNQLSNRR